MAQQHQHQSVAATSGDVESSILPQLAALPPSPSLVSWCRCRICSIYFVLHSRKTKGNHYHPSRNIRRYIDWKLLVFLYIVPTVIMNIEIMKELILKQYSDVLSSSSLSAQGFSTSSSESSSSSSSSLPLSSVSSFGSSSDHPPSSNTTNQRCAINFFGLPRAYESLVLPSIITNIIQQNMYCDYYVHYYYMTEEVKGRSGAGGTIDPTATLLLRDTVHAIAIARNEHPLPIVEFISDTEEEFWIQYNTTIEKIRNVKVDGQYLYFPWRSTSYTYPDTMDNIVKMWHSIQSAFELMERTGKVNNIQYKTVAMFRSDVIYVTPININDIPRTPDDDVAAVEDEINNSTNNGSHQPLPPVIVPDFGNHPVSDRMIYGPIEAVRMWATQRFNHLDEHVERMHLISPGFGMHSERFVSNTLFPLIRNITTIRKHPTICFFRARADETVWVSDCQNDNAKVAAPSIMANFHNTSLVTVVENAIQRSCPEGAVPTKRANHGLSLNCSNTLPTSSSPSIDINVV